MKTLIELFDTCQLKNVISSLGIMPEKIVFIGFKENIDPDRRDAIKHFLKMRSINPVIEYETVPEYDFEAICEKLVAVADANPHCCFDLTGGRELVLAAMGYISAMRNLPMIQFDISSGRFIPVKNCNPCRDIKKPVMSIRDSVILNGGKIVHNDKNDFNWQLTDDFKRDIEVIWDICRRNCGLWNRQCTVFANFILYGECRDKRIVIADLASFRRHRSDTMLNDNVLKPLMSAGLIKDLKRNRSNVRIEFKNEQVMRAICKAGNALELYVYMLANELLQPKGSAFNDIDIGVVVDWDRDRGDKDAGVVTKNEIDLMFMRGVVPVFVSCKNGEVRKEDLYEIASIAERFGGEYAVKVLIATYISNDASGRRHLLKRASEMGIRVIDGVDSMPRDKLIELLALIK